MNAINTQHPITPALKISPLLIAIDPKYVSLSIPYKIWSMKELSLIKRVFLAQIYTACQGPKPEDKKYCFMSNAFFAEWSTLSARRCRTIISELHKAKLIRIVEVNHQRRITIAFDVPKRNKRIKSTGRIIAPNNIWECKIKPNEKWFLLTIKDNINTEDGYCWKPNEEFARNSGKDISTCERAIAKLCKLGVVHSERVYPTKEHPKGSRKLTILEPTLE